MIKSVLLGVVRMKWDGSCNDLGAVLHRRSPSHPMACDETVPPVSSTQGSGSAFFTQQPGCAEKMQGRPAPTSLSFLDLFTLTQLLIPPNPHPGFMLRPHQTCFYAPGTLPSIHFLFMVFASAVPSAFTPLHLVSSWLSCSERDLSGPVCARSSLGGLIPSCFLTLIMNYLVCLCVFIFFFNF